MTPAEIARFQAEMLEILAIAQTEPNCRHQLQDCCSDPALLTYLNQAEPSMLELAQRLVQMWGQRASS